MSRHVDRIVQRPHAVRRSHLQSLPRALHSINTHAQHQRTEQDDETRLRVADQRSLRDMHVQTDRLIEGVNKLWNSVSRVPTTIRNPHIDRPYTLSQLQNRVTKEVPSLARKTTETIQHVQAHLKDLQTEPYVEKKDEAAATREFEEEIKHWTTKEKQEKLQDLKYEEEAREVKLKQTAVDLEKQLREMQGGNRPEAKRSEASPTASRIEDGAKTVAYAPAVKKPSAAKSKDQPTTEGKQSASSAQSKLEEPAEDSLQKIKERLEAKWKGG